MGFVTVSTRTSPRKLDGSTADSMRRRSSIPEGDPGDGCRVFHNAANPRPTPRSTLTSPLSPTARRLPAGRGAVGVEICVRRITVEGTDPAVVDLVEGARLVTSSMAD